MMHTVHTARALLCSARRVASVSLACATVQALSELVEATFLVDPASENMDLPLGLP